MTTLTIDNHGPLIVRTNYWETEYAQRGVLYLSINAGAFRLLVPPGLQNFLSEVRTATEVIVSRGPWPEQRRAEMIEVMFEDGTDSPFSVHFGAEQIDRLPPASDAGRELIFTAWTAPRRGRPHKAYERPAWYRIVPRIPWMKSREDL